MLISPSELYLFKNIMTTTKTCQIHIGIGILLALFALPLLPGYSDTVTLKDGTKLEGEITMQAKDFIKLVLARSGSIKETKLIKRSDIQKIEKVNPDALALAKMKARLPAPSLLTSSGYQGLIKTGPESFLKAFPDSPLKGEAQKILEELNAEKAKVDRGAIKLNGKWITAERRQNFKSLIKSQVIVYTMKQKAARNEYTSALRSLQTIEEKYLGTPAYPEAIKIALAILPPYGNLLTRQLKDAEFLNKKREADIKLLPPTSRAQTEAAYRKEQDRFKALAEQEKKTGIKWRSVNSRNKESIAPMITTIRAELSRLSQIDTAKLKAQARELVKVDELINENKLTEAKELLVATGGKITTIRKRSNSRNIKTKSSYSSDLSNKIALKIKAAEEAAENATVNAKAKKVAAAITQSASKITKKGEKAAMDDKAKAEGEKSDSAEDALEAAIDARKKVADAKKQADDAKAAASATKRPKSTKKKTQPKKPPTSAASSDEGGPSIQLILIGFAAVMGIVIFILKKKGIGGKGDGGGGGDEGE